MNKVGKIDFKEIRRISPSQFYSMKNCAYKSLLAEAFEKKPLLPISPNAYFGIVLHKILELIAKGLIRDEHDFNRFFFEQVNLQEEKMTENGFDFFVPLQKSVRDFGMKIILLKKHLRNISEKTTNDNHINYHSEKWLESADKLIAGKIDLIIEADNEIEILDFKTGAITHDFLDDTGEIFSEVKQEYQEQLKLYAQLYFENTGRYPTQLSVVDLARQKFTVDFTSSECSEIFDEAKILLHITNESIIKRKFTATPTLTNCKYCLYRPACTSFQKLLETDLSFNDASGIIKNVIKYQNGNVSVFLESGERKIIVQNFLPELFDELNERKGEQIYFFNLRKETIELVFSATKTTMIYE